MDGGMACMIVVLGIAGRLEGYGGNNNDGTVLVKSLWMILLIDIITTLTELPSDIYLTTLGRLSRQ